MSFDAVLLDFYGTLARATRWLSIDDVLADHGVALPAEVRLHFWHGGIDGTEHLEHSRSREHYAAWQRQRLLSMLAETDVHPGEHEEIARRLAAGTAARVLEPYPEVVDVLAELRGRGLRLAICSNWDWDLNEAVEEVGLREAVDVIVSSAWVGARKPHPRIFEDTLAKIGGDPGATVFVGDTWKPDVVGPRDLGMTPCYLQRDGHWPDETAPDDLGDVLVARDLRSLLEVCAPA